VSLLGVDVASFQGQPGQWQAHAGAIDFAAVKVTELQPGGGEYVNPDALADWAYLGQRGTARIGYLFAHPSTLPSETAGLFAAILGHMGLQPGDGIAIDLETTDGLGPAQVAAWGRAVAGALQAVLRRPPLVYTFPDFGEAGYCAGLGQYPLWISDPSSPMGHPVVPQPWESWAIHQFAAPAGGIDRDIAAWPSPAAMRAAVGLPASPSALPEDAMLLNKGAGAVTPLAIPSGAAAVRLYCAGAAELEYQFPGDPAQRLALAGFSAVIRVPPGHHAVKITRVDAGTGDVCAVSE
jgi:lysozyme